MPPDSRVITSEIVIPEEHYRYLWLKRVRGFDPNNHCAKCLIGDYETRALPFPQHRRQVGFIYRRDISLRPDGEYLYLCGVWWPPDWFRNMHVLVQPGDGEVHFESRGIIAHFYGAQQLEIPELPTTDRTELAALGLKAGKAFTTCRNYQAGYMLFGDRMSPSRYEGDRHTRLAATMDSMFDA